MQNTEKNETPKIKSECFTFQKMNKFTVFNNNEIIHFQYHRYVENEKHIL